MAIDGDPSRDVEDDSVCVRNTDRVSTVVIKNDSLDIPTESTACGPGLHGGPTVTRLGSSPPPDSVTGSRDDRAGDDADANVLLGEPTYTIFRGDGAVIDDVVRSDERSQTEAVDEASDSDAGESTGSVQIAIDDEETADQPGVDAPDESATDAPDESTIDAPDESATDAPDESATDAPDESTIDSPDESTIDAPDESTIDDGDQELETASDGIVDESETVEETDSSTSATAPAPEETTSSESAGLPSIVRTDDDLDRTESESSLARDEPRDAGDSLTEFDPPARTGDRDRSDGCEPTEPVDEVLTEDVESADSHSTGDRLSSFDSMDGDRSPTIEPTGEDEDLWHGDSWPVRADSPSNGPPSPTEEDREDDPLAPADSAGEDAGEDADGSIEDDRPSTPEDRYTAEDRDTRDDQDPSVNQDTSTDSHHRESVDPTTSDRSSKATRAERDGRSADRHRRADRFSPSPREHGAKNVSEVVRGILNGDIDHRQFLDHRLRNARSPERADDDTRRSPRKRDQNERERGRHEDRADRGLNERVESSDRRDLASESSHVRGERSESHRRQFERDERSPARFERDERSPGRFERDERSPGRFGRDERSPGRFGRDERPPGRSKRDEGSSGRFGRDGRAPERFGRDDDQSRFGREDEPANEEKIRDEQDARTEIPRDRDRPHRRERPNVPGHDDGDASARTSRPSREEPTSRTSVEADDLATDDPTADRSRDEAIDADEQNTEPGANGRSDTVAEPATDDLDDEVDGHEEPADDAWDSFAEGIDSAWETIENDESANDRSSDDESANDESANDESANDESANDESANDE